MAIDVRNVMIGIRNILPSNMILAQDVEIEKLYFMVKIQSGNFVLGCSPNSMLTLQSLLIMLEHMMHILYTIIYLCRVLLLK